MTRTGKSRVAGRRRAAAVRRGAPGGRGRAWVREGGSPRCVSRQRRREAAACAWSATLRPRRRVRAVPLGRAARSPPARARVNDLTHADDRPGLPPAGAEGHARCGSSRSNGAPAPARAATCVIVGAGHGRRSRPRRSMLAHEPRLRASRDRRRRAQAALQPRRAHRPPRRASRGDRPAAAAEVVVPGPRHRAGAARSPTSTPRRAWPTLADGTPLAYDALVLATGSAPCASARRRHRARDVFAFRVAGRHPHHPRPRPRRAPRRRDRRRAARARGRAGGLRNRRGRASPSSTSPTA